MPKIRLPYYALVSFGLLLTLLLAACGSNSGTGGYGGVGTGATQATTPGPTATQAPSPTSTSSSNNYCTRYCTQPSPTATGTSNGAVVIKSASISVGGKTETVLTDAQGKTLYYRTTDTPTSVCTGGCASAWPPVLGTTAPASPSGFPGKLTVLTDANGSQLAYNGHPLYTFSGDSGPGQSKGQNVLGIWFVVTPALTA